MHVYIHNSTSMQANNAGLASREEQGSLAPWGFSGSGGLVQGFTR